MNYDSVEKAVNVCLNRKRTEKKDEGAHYRYKYKGIKLDPYRIAEIYKIHDNPSFTILKKVLRSGRAHKDLRQDLKDIICAAERKLEMLDEDHESENMDGICP